MLLVIKLVLDLISGALFSIGGWKIIQLRRFAMPVIIGAGVSMSSGLWWLGLTVLPVMGTLCLAYFFKGQQSLSWLSRGLWLGLQALVIGLGSFLLGHLAWYFYIPYIIVAFGLGALLFSIQQIIGDIIFGCWLGIIILFCH